MLVGGRAPIGGGGLIRLLTLIPDTESPRLSLSMIPDGAIGTHIRGSGVIVGLAVTSAEIDIEIDGEGVSDAVSDTVKEGVGEDIIDGVSVIEKLEDIVGWTEDVIEVVEDLVSVIVGVIEDVGVGVIVCVGVI